MTSARFLLAFAVVVGSLAAPLSAGAASPSAPETQREVTGVAAATDAEVSDALEVQLVPAASGILRAGSDLQVSVTLSNRSGADVPASSALLYIGRQSVADHLDLAEWLADAPDGAAAGSLIAEVATPPLASGDSVVLPAIVVPAASVPLENPSAFGVHELEVRVDSGAGGVVGARSSITVDPGVGAPPASVAAVMPLTVPSETIGLIPAEQLEQLTAPGGTLARELDQADGRPIALAIDPRIILSIRVLGDSAPDFALAWLDRLESVPNVTFPLSYADSDVAATSQVGAGVLTPTSFGLDPDVFPTTIDTEPGPSASASPSPSPSASASPVDPTAPQVPTLDDLLAWDYTRDDLVWPREMTVVSGDLDTFAGAGDEIALLTSTNLVADSDDSAPSPISQVGSHEVLVSNATVSALFREAVTATTTPQWESAVARLTGSLASIAAEGPASGESQLALMSLARDSASGSFRLAETLDAITVNPWSSAVPLTSALSVAPVSATLLETPVAPARLDQIRSLLSAESQAAAFATVLADPMLVTGERRLALLSLLSQTWAIDETEWPSAITAYVTRSGEIASSVQVDTTGTITVLADNGDLPISISNVLDFPVTVYVTVTSPRLILSVRETQVPVTVEANSQKRASIPVQSIANGAVTISIALSSATGVAIGDTAFADVTVSAGWETAATTVLGVLVALVFIAGIVRTVRRRRRGLGVTSDNSVNTEGTSTDSATGESTARRAANE